MINVAVMGYGTVGSGVVEVLRMNAESINERVGKKVKLKYILDIRDFPDGPYKDLMTKNFEDIKNDESVKVVAETMGGINPAYEYTKELLNAGKHVITSNKELVSIHGTELLQLAKEKNVNYLFEASVGGGIPIIGPLYRCMSSNDITEIAGILNGTTNYILTQMIKNGERFDVALKDAQKKGYAEVNPEADIEGIDACRKIAILSSLMCGFYINPDKVNTQGITNVTLADVKYAEKMNCVIKLIGHSKLVNNRIYAKVAPMLINKTHPLASVEDVFNAIMVKGNAVDDVMFYGKGAGMMPTASAVTADMIDACKHLNRHIGIIWSQREDDIYCDPSEIKNSYFIRIKSNEDIKNDLRSIVNIKKIIENVNVNEIGVITEEVYESEIDEIFNIDRKSVV